MQSEPSRRWNAPLTREGQVWHGQFNRHLFGWLRDGGEEDLLKAAAALKTWLGRAPEDAATIQFFALGAVFNARLRGARTASLEFARAGREAELLLAPGETAGAGVRALLALYLSEAELRLRRRYPGEDSLRLAEDLLLRQPPPEPLVACFDGHARYLRGALFELGAAFDEAAQSYAAAARQLSPLVLSDEPLAKAGIALLHLVLGEGLPGSAEQQEQLFLLAVGEIRLVAALNAIGLVRARETAGDAAGAARAAPDAWRVVLRSGLDTRQAPLEMGPLGLLPVVLALPEEQARECVATLADKVGGAIGNRADWQAVLCSGRLARDQDGKLPSWWSSTLEAALPKIRDPLAAAFVESRLFLQRSARSRPRPAEAARFARSLRALPPEQLAALEQPLARALLDEALAGYADAASRALGRRPDALARARLAALIDAQRGASVAALAEIPDVPPAPGGAEAGMLAARDRLQRIAWALRGHPRTVAIVLQRGRGGYVAVCIRGDAARPLHVIEAGARCEAAFAALAGHVNKQIQAAQVSGDYPAASGVKPAGIAAYRALPKGLRELIRRSKTLLIVPDYRSGLDALPFELLHDGREFLGASRVLARFSSLRSLCRAVERLARRPAARVALVAAASRTGRKPLPRAHAEARAIRTLLARAGWFAPRIAERRQSPELFADTLERAALLHIAAHGELGEPGQALGEAIVLPNGQRFTSDDLLRKFYPQLPLAYINCCSLGASRYLGAGVTRGIAHTLVEAGAPAAIANLLPVDDEVATALAREFHVRSRRHSVGEALRLARRELGRRGKNPILWGSTVLIGDPWATLEPLAPERSASEQLLDEYFVPAKDAGRAATDAHAAIRSQPEDARLQAALVLRHEAETVTDLASAAQRERWSRVVRLADEVDHLPASAVARAAAAHASAGALSAAETLRLAEDATRYLKAMNARGQPLLHWEQAVERARARADERRMHELLGAGPEDLEDLTQRPPGGNHAELR